MGVDILNNRTVDHNFRASVGSGARRILIPIGTAVALGLALAGDRGGSRVIGPGETGNDEPTPRHGVVFEVEGYDANDQAPGNSGNDPAVERQLGGFEVNSEEEDQKYRGRSGNDPCAPSVHRPQCLTNNP